jgi:hypothetical protein
VNNYALAGENAFDCLSNGCHSGVRNRGFLFLRAETGIKTEEKRECIYFLLSLFPTKVLQIVIRFRVRTKKDADYAQLPSFTEINCVKIV